MEVEEQQQAKVEVLPDGAVTVDGSLPLELMDIDTPEKLLQYVWRLELTLKKMNNENRHLKDEVKDLKMVLSKQRWQMQDLLRHEFKLGEEKQCAVGTVATTGEKFKASDFI